MEPEVTRPDRDALEAMIDKFSLANVVGALALVCLDKAEHLRGNWQDETSAKSWDRASRILETACKKI